MFNNCIGKRNQHYYLLFLVSSILHIVDTVLTGVLLLVVRYSEHYYMVQERRNPSLEQHNISCAFMILIGMPCLVLLLLSLYFLLSKLFPPQSLPLRPRELPLFSPDAYITVDSI